MAHGISGKARNDFFIAAFRVLPGVLWAKNYFRPADFDCQREISLGSSAANNHLDFEGATRRCSVGALATEPGTVRPEEIVIRSRRPLSSTGERKNRLKRTGDERG